MTTINIISNCTEKAVVLKYLEDRKIHKVYTSSAPNATEFARSCAVKAKCSALIVEEFREAVITGENLVGSLRKFWDHPEVRGSGMESRCQVQERFLDGIQMILEEDAGKEVVVSTHPVAAACFLAYFDPSFTLEELIARLQMGTWFIKVGFEGMECIDLEEIRCV